MVLKGELTATPRSRPREARLLRVFRQHVHLQVHGSAGLGGAECGAFQRLGDERYQQARVVDLHHGQRDPIHSNRPLLHDVAQEGERRGHADHAGRSRLRPRARPSPIPSTCPWTTCPPSPIGRPERQLEVHLVAHGERAQRASLERLRHQIGGKPTLCPGSTRREADAVDRDRLARGELSPRAASAHAGARPRSGGLHRLHSALVGHQPGEHQRLTTRSASPRSARRRRSAPCPSRARARRTGDRLRAEPLHHGAGLAPSGQDGCDENPAPRRSRRPRERLPIGAARPRAAATEPRARRARRARGATRADSFSPVATITSAPALWSASTAVRDAAREVTTVTGTSAAPRTSRPRHRQPGFAVEHDAARLTHTRPRSGP